MRQVVESGSPYEKRYGYSRAVVTGTRVVVGGTAPIWESGEVDPDPGVQARRCLEIILQSLESAGTGPEQVVRTRMYITDPAYADAVGSAHAEVFGDVRPVTTMVVTGLIDARWKVEIEAEAEL